MKTTRLTRLAVVLIAALTATGCGTRRDIADIAATYNGAGGTGAAAPTGAPPGSARAVTGGSTAAPAVGTSSPTATPAGGPSTAAGTGAAGSSAAAATRPAATRPTAAGGRNAADTTAGPTGSTAPSAAAGRPVAAGTAGSSAAGPNTAAAPIKVASVGTYSGIVGQNVAPGVKGVQAWVATVNEQGGVAGHPVDLVVADDGGDPARHASLVQQLVEQQNVIAFVYNAAPLGGQASVDYLNRKRVPVMGSEMVSDWFYSSPMFFPQGSTGRLIPAAMLGNAADQLKPEGKTKVGVVVCSEGIEICKQMASEAPKAARDNGLDVVYQGQASLAQPDFTGECLNAQRAGAQMIAVSMDMSSLTRLARSCASVGYHPTWVIAQMIAFAQLATDPNLEGTTVASVVAPWTAGSIPGVAAFQAAMRRFAPATEPSGAALAGWVSAKMLERAATATTLPATVTAASILDGLWTFRDETLDGTTSPLTFQRDRPAVPRLCYGHLRIQGKQFTSPDGGRMTCR